METGVFESQVRNATARLVAVVWIANTMRRLQCCDVDCWLSMKRTCTAVCLDHTLLVYSVDCSAYVRYMARTCLLTVGRLVARLTSLYDPFNCPVCNQLYR